MGRLLRSTLSDPIGSAINAFATFSNALDSIENNKQRRQITDLQLQREKLAIDKEQKLNAAMGDVQTLLNNAPYGDIEKMVPYADAIRESEESSQKGVEWNPSQEYRDAVITASAHSPLITDNPEEIQGQAEAAHYINNFVKNNMTSFPKGRHMLNSDNAPELISNINKFYGTSIDKGSDRYGLSVDKDGVSKEVKSVLVNNDDPTNPTISFILNVKSPVREGQVFRHVGDTAPRYTVDENAQGMSEVGNIDLSQRPVRRNADGSISTILSMSIEDGGKTVLIPRINQSGKLLSSQEAIKEYQKSGKHLGKFDSEDDADLYAETLHSDPMWEGDIKKYSAKGKTEVEYNAPLSLGRDADPNAPIAQVPAQLMFAQVNQASKTLSALQKIMALSNPVEFAKEYITKIEKRNVDQNVVKTLRSIPKDLKPQEKMDWLLAHKPEGIDWDKWGAIITPKGSITPYEAIKIAQGQEKLNIDKLELERKKSADVENRKEKIREFDLKQKEISGKKAERNEDKETKRRDDEIGKLKSSMDNEKKNIDDPKELEKIDTRYNEMIDRIREGKSRTATEAKNVVDSKANKENASFERQLDLYGNKYNPKDYKGVKVSLPNGVVIESNGKRWKKVQ